MTQARALGLRPARRRAPHARCRWRPTLPRRCRHTARASTVSSCSRRAASASAGAIAVRAGRPSCNAATIGSISASCAALSLSPPRARFCRLGSALFQAVEIGQHQLGLDRLGVADRIDAAFDMGDVGILEAAQHVDDGIDLADIGEELVAQALALAGAAHQPGDVDEFQRWSARSSPICRCAPARPAAGRARRRGRHSARWCRTDSSPPAPPRSRSAR